MDTGSNPNESSQIPQPESENTNAFSGFDDKPVASSAPPPQQPIAEPPQDSGKRPGFVVNLIACIFGGASIIFFALLFLPIAVILAVIGLFQARKARNSTATILNIVAWVLIVIAAVISPTIWLLFAGIFVGTLAVTSTPAPTPAKPAPKPPQQIERKMEAPTPPPPPVIAPAPEPAPQPAKPEQSIILPPPPPEPAAVEKKPEQAPAARPTRPRQPTGQQRRPSNERFVDDIKIR